MELEWSFWFESPQPLPEFDLDLQPPLSDILSFLESLTLTVLLPHALLTLTGLLPHADPPLGFRIVLEGLEKVPEEFASSLFLSEPLDVFLTILDGLAMLLSELEMLLAFFWKI